MTETDKPTCYIVAGPNGAGKTTFAMIYLPQWGNCREFLNADLIAAGLAPLAPETQNVTAGKLLLRRIAQLTEKRQSFGFETTLAGKGWIKAIDRFKDNGFHVMLYYLWLPDPQMAVSRVRNRVQQGGHFIPDETVKRRYANGLRNFITHYQDCVDDWLLYNAAPEQPLLVAEQLGGTTQIYDDSIYLEIVQSARDH